MPQLEHIEAIENRLWGAADNLRANSTYASNEYFLPVMGLVFLRYAYSRYLSVKDGIEANLPTRGGKKRPLTKEDFSQKNAIYLRPNAQFDHLVALPDSEDRIKAVIEAMETIETDYESLRGALPKSEYQELDNDVLGQLLRTLNPDELKQVSGDVFGRIYEYFLTQFADEKAHDDGEFFTPVSLVSLIAHVLEPNCGTVLDPACGSGGMFVQSARTVEEHGQHPTEQLTFRGIEKNATTIRLAKMNLAVHGLEGNIQQAITYYEDPHELLGKADYVMANPPFNVDEIDADKVKTDPRLPFGLPGVNKENKVSSGNYVWISYFYSYLNETGRAGFVMSSQASSAGSNEAEVRRKLVETGDVEAMIAIRSNFFYTRTVPCELWFLNRDKPEAHRDKVLMIDARNIYRQVTRKIYDFSPEQQQNILAIVHLYRGETERFLGLVSNYLQRILKEGHACFKIKDGETIHPLPDFLNALTQLHDLSAPSLKTLPKNGQHAETLAEYDKARTAFAEAIEQFRTAITETASNTRSDLNKQVAEFAPLIEISRDLSERTDSLYKLAIRITDICETSSTINNRTDITRARRTADEARQIAIEQLKQVHYFYQQAQWLTSRFPRSETVRRRRTGQTGRSRRNQSQRLEPDPWPLRRRCTRRRRRKFRLRQDPARDPRRTGRTQRRGRIIGSNDQAEF